MHEENNTHKEKEISLIVNDILSTHLPVIIKKIQQEIDEKNAYTLDPKEFLNYIQNETDALLSFFKTGEIHWAAAQGKQAVIEGLDKDMFTMLYDAVFACCREHISRGTYCNIN